MTSFSCFLGEMQSSYVIREVPVTKGDWEVITNKVFSKNASLIIVTLYFVIKNAYTRICVHLGIRNAIFGENVALCDSFVLHSSNFFSQIWVDEDRKLVYFMALKDSPLELHL